MSPIATTSRIRTSRSSSRWRGERRRSSDGEAAGDPADLGRRADRDDDPLAAAADDARARNRPASRARPARSPAGIRRDPARLGDRLAGEDAPVERAARRSATAAGRPGRRPRSGAGRRRPGPVDAAATSRTVPPRRTRLGRRARGPERLERPLAAVLGEDVGADDRQRARSGRARRRGPRRARSPGRRRRGAGRRTARWPPAGPAARPVRAASASRTFGPSSPRAGLDLLPDSRPRRGSTSSRASDLVGRPARGRRRR